MAECMIEVVDEHTIAVRTPYHIQWIAAFKEHLPKGVRKWDKDSKRWIVDRGYIDVVCDVTRKFFRGVKIHRVLMDEYNRIKAEFSGFNPSNGKSALVAFCQSIPPKTLYRVLSRAFHPDVGGDTEIMKRLNAAWDKDNQ